MKIMKQRINIILHKKHINMLKRLGNSSMYRNESRSSIIRTLVGREFFNFNLSEGVKKNDR